MKHKKIATYYLILLILSIPFNFIVISNVGNVYWSTIIILAEFFLLFFIKPSIFIKRSVIVGILIYFLIVLESVINIFLGELSLSKEVVQLIIYFQILSTFIIARYILGYISIDYIFKILLVAVFLTFLRVIIEEPDHILKLSILKGERIEAYFASGVNNYAMLMGIGLLICFFRYKNLLIKYIMLFFWTMCMVLTMSRGALLGVFLTLFIVAYYDKNRETFKQLVKLGSISIFLLFLGFIFSNDIDSIVEQVNERFFSLFSGEKDLSQFSSGRGVIWPQMIDRFIDTPIYNKIIGHGLSSIDFEFFISGHPHAFESSHNIFLDLLFKNGILLMLAYILFIIYILLLFLKNRSIYKLVLFSVFIFFQIELWVNPFIFAAQIGWLYGFFIMLFYKQNKLLYEDD